MTNGAASFLLMYSGPSSTEPIPKEDDAIVSPILPAIEPERQVRQSQCSFSTGAYVSVRVLIPDLSVFLVHREIF